MDDSNDNFLQSENALKLSAEFLLAEFTALQDRAIALTNSQSNRVNFLLILVAATLAGIGQIASNPLLQAYLTPVIQTAALGVLVLGLFTLRHNVDDAGATVNLFRRAGRIRLWFVEQNPRIAGYVPFEYADDKPAMDVPFLSFRGAEAILFLINALAFCTLVVTTIRFANNVFVLVEFLIAFVIAWVSQAYYVHNVLRKEELRSASGAKFPYEKMRKKFEES